MDVKMKKKLTLGLAQIMGPHHNVKPDDRDRATPVHNNNSNIIINGIHHGHAVASPPPSPYPGHRTLPSKAEADLRAACAAVLHNTKPSHHYAAPGPDAAHHHAAPDPDAARTPKPKPQLDYTTIKKSASIRRSADSRPHVDRSDSAESNDPAKHAYRPDVALEHPLPLADAAHDYVQPGSVKPRNGSVPRRKPVPKSVVSPDPETNDSSRAPNRSGSGETSGSTPHTDTTEYLWSTSTAPTSAGVTPARASKRASGQFQPEAEHPPKPDPAAAEWMQNEHERRRKKVASPATDHDRAAQPDSRASSRPRSRVRSIRDNIKQYIRPGSASVSRESSRPATRTHSRAASTHNSVHPSASELPHERSHRAWRDWTKRSRKSDKSPDVSRSNSVSGRGRSETRKEARKPTSSTRPEINLNRDLPPLPSLDQWKEAVQEPGPLKSPPVRRHRPTNSKHSLGSTSFDSTVSEKDEIIAMRLGSPMKQPPDVYKPARSAKPSQGENNLVFHAQTVDRLERTLTHEERARSSHALHESVHQRSKSTHPPHRRTKSSVRAVHASPGESSSASTPRVNYSRLRSPSDEAAMDPEFQAASAGFSKHRNYDRTNIPPALASPTSNASSKPSHESRYRHVMDMLSHREPPPVPAKEESKKGWWHVKLGAKGKNQNWMDRLEKMHARNGVLNNDEACGSPVIRY